MAPPALAGTRRLESVPPLTAGPKSRKLRGWVAVKFYWSAELTDVGGDASRVKHRVHLGSAAVIAASGMAAPVRHQTQPQSVMPGNLWWRM